MNDDSIIEAPPGSVPDRLTLAGTLTTTEPAGIAVVRDQKTGRIVVVKRARPGSVDESWYQK